MEMTIDSVIIQATLLKDGISKDKYKYEILTTLIDTAKKYQKIKELMDKEVPECIHPFDRDKYKLEAIRKVLEDGNGR